jgi:pimeloyl-ACP methyl ester carboxylesterase
VARDVVELGFAPAPDGARLAFQLRGPADAPPLLLLPGQANSHRWWRRLRVPFAREFRTITFDYRGTGRTECEIGDWSTESFATDAAAVLDHLGYDRANVYGTSMGGRVAQMLALQGRISRLALACTSPGGPHALDRGPDVRKALANPDWPTRRATLLDLMYTPAYARREDSTLLGDPTMSRAASVRHLRVSARHDAYDRLPEIAIPVLVLHGRDDRMAPAGNAHLIAAQLPDADLEITQGRHGFFEEFADAVTPRVIGFLRGL